MKFNKSLTIILLLFGLQSFSQSNLDAKLSLIKSVKEYCVTDLNMNVSNQYYTDWATSDKPNYYIYVSEKDSIKSAFSRAYLYYVHNLERAETKKIEFNERGYSTLLYKTYGTSGTRLSKRLLSYSNESLAFIAFHEATHQHVRNNGKIPYSFEESLCDLIGNYGMLKLFEGNNDLKNKKARKHIKQIEDISQEINNIILTHSDDFSCLNKKIEKVNKPKYKFKRDRYCYEVNNAYLLRNKDYTLHYYKLKELMMLTNNLKEFLDFATHLPNDEIECLKIVDAKLKTLRISSI